MRDTSIEYASHDMDEVCSEGKIQAFLGPLNLHVSDECIDGNVFTLCMLKGCRMQTLRTYNEGNRDCSDNSCPQA